MSKFKVGDRLIWRGVFDASMYTVGKEYEIAKEYVPGRFYVTDDNVGVEDTRHTWPDEDIEPNFELVARSPIRTVTRREIVPGVYGDVRISSHDDRGVEVHIDDYLDVKDLRAAAALFNELADVLDEQKDAA